jgi:hypothetical protein
MELYSNKLLLVIISFRDTKIISRYIYFNFCISTTVAYLLNIIYVFLVSPILAKFPTPCSFLYFIILTIPIYLYISHIYVV